MPRLWSETIGAHRHEVREAILDGAEQLAAESGALSVSMSGLAEAAGIGRATLYKYFPDIESVWVAWHERHVDEHLRELTDIATSGRTPAERLADVLEAYAVMRRHRPRSDLAAGLHRGPHMLHAHRRLTGLVQQLIADAARLGAVRDDVPPGELAAYCLQALTTAERLPSRAAVRRLVRVVLSGLHHDKR